MNEKSSLLSLKQMELIWHFLGILNFFFENRLMEIVLLSKLEILQPLFFLLKVTAEFLMYDFFVYLIIWMHFFYL